MTASKQGQDLEAVIRNLQEIYQCRMYSRKLVMMGREDARNILIFRPCILNVVYVFLLWSMYSYCSSIYSYCCLCILIVIYVFLDAATLTEVFPFFFLGCKANARVILTKTGHGPHSSKIVVLFSVLFVSYRSMYCLCVNVYCHRVTTQLQLTNIPYIICRIL